MRSTIVPEPALGLDEVGLPKEQAMTLFSPFVVRESKIQGKEAFAIRNIRKGTRLIEYLGQRISWRTADKRYDDEKMGRHHTFLFTVDDKVVIDAAVNGNDADGREATRLPITDHWPPARCPVAVGTDATSWTGH